MQRSALVVKQEFLSRWIKGLQIYSRLNKEMSVVERKKAIKLSADVAMAATRSGSTRWSRAVVASASGAAERKATCIVRKTHSRVRRSKPKAGSSAAIAKKLVRNRTRVLKRLVPGAHKLDHISLIKETLDYISSLQLQVDVMRHLAAAATAQQFSF